MSRIVGLNGLRSRLDCRDGALSPEVSWEETDGNQHQLGTDEAGEGAESAVHESVRVEPHSEHVHAEPRQAGDDVSEDRHRHDALFTNVASPAGVEDHGIPEDDEKRAVLLRVPAPKPPPRLIRPDAAQDGSDEAEEQ